MNLYRRGQQAWENKWVRHGAFALLLLVIYVGVRTYQQRDLVLGQAPAFDVETLSGTRFVLPGDTHPTLVYFWATWCPVCRVEHGSIDALAAEYRVVAVAMQSGTNAELAGYLREHPWRVPTSNDLSGEQAANWGVHVTPTFFIVDSQGRIRYREVGYTTELGLRFRLWLAS